MNKTATAQAIYDMLMERVPELVYIEKASEANKIIRAIIKGLEEAEKREKIYG